jgi:phospholipid:diacylglycerol acyltransferase
MKSRKKKKVSRYFFSFPLISLMQRRNRKKSATGATDINIEQRQTGSASSSSILPDRPHSPSRPSDPMQPEDILGDSGLFKPKQQQPFWKRKRFNFVIGVTVGLLATYCASTTPTANDLQSYLALQLADMDLTSAGVAMDDLFGNFTNFFNPSTIATEETFMPAWSAK